MKKPNFKTTLSGCFVGYFVQAINVNLTPVLFVIFQDSYRISLKMLSTLILCSFLMQLAVDLFSPPVTDSLGYRATMLLALAVAAIGLALLGALPQLMDRKFLAIFIATMVFSAGSGLLEVIVSPIANSLPLGEKKSTMSLLHSFYCWGQLIVVLVTTLYIKFAGANLWYILPFVWALVPLADFILFLFVPLVPELSPEERTPARTLLSDKKFFIAFIVMLCAGACEMVIAQWSSLFAERGLGVSKFVGDLLGPCIFALLMGAGRLIYGIFGERLQINKILLWSGVLCIVCYLVTALFPNRYVSLLGCGACGLAVSMLWPGTLAKSAETFPQAGTLLFGVLAFAGDLGCSAGPALAGYVADAVRGSAYFVALAERTGTPLDQLALRGGIGVCLIFPIILTLCLFLLVKKPSLKKLRRPQ